MTQKAQAASVKQIIDDLTGESSQPVYKDGMTVRLACVITAVRLKSTKNGSMMAYVTAEDDTAAIELVVFPRSLQQCGAYLRPACRLSPADCGAARFAVRQCAARRAFPMRAEAARMASARSEPPSICLPGRAFRPWSPAQCDIPYSFSLVTEHNFTFIFQRRIC